MKSLFLLSLIFLVGCDSEIFYVQDNKTGLCFAKQYISRGGSITCVPCSKEVLDAIKNQKANCIDFAPLNPFYERKENTNLKFAKRNK